MELSSRGQPESDNLPYLYLARKLCDNLHYVCMQALLQLPERVLFKFVALRSVHLLNVIRLLPPALHRVALEAKHPELNRKKLFLRYSYRGQSERFHTEIVDVLDTISSHFSGLHVLELDTGIVFNREESKSLTLSLKLSATLQSLTHLVRLQIIGGLNSVLAAGLAEALPLMPELQRFDVLDMQDQLPATGRGCFNNVLGSLARLRSLRSLKMCGFRDISTAAISGFCAALSQLRSLTALCLRSCFHWSKGGTVPHWACGLHVPGEVGAALVVLKGLKSLQLIECFSVDFIEPVLTAIGHIKSLTHLNLSRLSHMPPEMVPDRAYVPCFNVPEESGAANIEGHSIAPPNFLGDLNYQKRLSPMLQKLSALQSLILSGSWMWGGDENMARSLCGLSRLTQLTLTGFHRPGSFWEAFGQRVTSLNCMRSLALQDNDLLPLEARQLLQGLATLPQLVCLRADVQPLATMYADLQTLTGLSRLELLGEDSSYSSEDDALQLELSKSLGTLGNKVHIVKV